MALDARSYERGLQGSGDLVQLERAAWTWLASDRQPGTGEADIYMIGFGDGTTITNTSDPQMRAVIMAARPPPGHPIT